MAENDTQLDALEEKISKQLDRLHYLMEQKRNPEFIKIEYKRFVDLVTQKYVILQNAVQDQKTQLSTEEYETQKTALEAQYKEDVISIAVAIDDELEGAS